ncbi:MAG TPA: hypothetical protein EYP30_08415 [Archaeoglobaceae archaeon]|nr:hypothetical protein [Archaeoglobaceae archaeon]
MKVVPVRLDDRKLKDLDILVRAGIFKNRSEALRKMIDTGMEKIDAEVKYLKRIDQIVSRLIDVDLNFKGELRKSLEEGRDRW